MGPHCDGLRKTKINNKIKIEFALRHRNAKHTQGEAKSQQQQQQLAGSTECCASNTLLYSGLEAYPTLYHFNVCILRSLTLAVPPTVRLRTRA